MIIDLFNNCSLFQGCQNWDFASNRKGREKLKIVKLQ